MEGASEERRWGRAVVGRWGRGRVDGGIFGGKDNDVGGVEAGEARVDVHYRRPGTRCRRERLEGAITSR